VDSFGLENPQISQMDAEKQTEKSGTQELRKKDKRDPQITQISEAGIPCL